MNPAPPRALNRLAALALLLAAGLGVCALAGWAVRQWVLARQLGLLAGETQRHLEFYQLSLESAMARNESLPRIIALERRLRDLLAAPTDPGRLAAADAYLKKIRRATGISETYLLDRSGLTLASSNAGEPGSFVQRSYGYRPYFLDAMRGGMGRFYGIGSTTGVPGYFLAAPIEREGSRIGAAVVKVSLDDFESALRRSGDPVLLVDRVGVVFLTPVAGWKYRTLQPLGPADQAELRQSRQDGDRPLTPLEARLGPGSLRVRAALGPRTVPGLPDPVQPGRAPGLASVMLLADTGKERQAALLAGISAAFAAAFALSLATYARLQRRAVPSSAGGGGRVQAPAWGPGAADRRAHQPSLADQRIPGGRRGGGP